MQTINLISDKLRMLWLCTIRSTTRNEPIKHATSKHKCLQHPATLLITSFWNAVLFGCSSAAFTLRFGWERG